MKCDVATDLIIDSLMDELSETEAEGLRRHLASCTACAEEESSMRAIWGSVLRLGAVQAPLSEAGG